MYRKSLIGVEFHCLLAVKTADVFSNQAMMHNSYYNCCNHCNNHSEPSSVSVCRSQAICGRIVLCEYILSMEVCSLFYIFIAGIQSNEDNETLIAKTCLAVIRLLP